MHKILRYLKVFVILACFSATPEIGAMQNVLDYIQTYGMPVAHKAAAILLFIPRKITNKLTSSVAQRYPTTIMYATLVGDLIAPDMMFNYLGNDEYRNHLFTQAIRHNDPEAVKKYLSARYEVNANNAEALRLAITLQNPTLVKLLLDNKADAQVIDSFGRTTDELVYVNSGNRHMLHPNEHAILQLLEPYREPYKNITSKIAQEALETLSSPNPGYQQAADPATIIKSYL